MTPFPSVTVRKFATVRYTIQDLIAKEALTIELATFLRIQIEAGKTLLISGGTGSGKTTLLNALTEFIPESERIVVIEDTRELRISKPNILAAECQTDLHSAPVDFHDLLKGALRPPLPGIFAQADRVHLQRAHLAFYPRSPVATPGATPRLLVAASFVFASSL
jgi:Flp pilus assembly CpaF family ATPase